MPPATSFELGFKSNPSALSITPAYDVSDDANFETWQNMYNGFVTRWGEELRATSALVGKTIVAIRFILKSEGSPTGLISCLVQEDGITAKGSFGSIDASTVPVTPQSYEFSGMTYLVPAGHITRVYLQYTGGDASNFIYVNTQFPDGFDGANTRLTWFDTGWNSSDDEDYAGVIWVA